MRTDLERRTDSSTRHIRLMLEASIQMITIAVIATVNVLEKSSKRKHKAITVNDEMAIPTPNQSVTNNPVGQMIQGVLQKGNGHKKTIGNFDACCN